MDTTPSTRYHPLPVKAINRIVGFANRFGLAKIDLGEPSLLAAARKATGLERFGDEFFLAGLRVLLDSIEAEARLNPFGRMQARAQTIDSLKNRLWANACFEANPQLAGRPVEAPVIIVGPIRSGTTRLQRLLAADGRFQYLRAWEGFNPAPRLGLPEMGRVARRAEVDKFLRVGHVLNPGAFIAHPMATDAADEELLLLNHSFCGFSALGLYDVPSYGRWLRDCDKTAGYRYMADLMNLISWSRGEDGGKRWILKAPQHMLDLDVLMRTFPDAKLVFTHRDPLKTVASTFSLMWNFSVPNTDRPIRAAVRDNWLGLCEEMARRTIRQRASMPQAQQLDVHYEDMNRDWRGTMRRIYDFAGEDLTPAAERAMAEWLDASDREGGHKGHRYVLEDFGITRDEVDARMKFLRDHYAIPYEVT